MNERTFHKKKSDWAVFVRNTSRALMVVALIFTIAVSSLTFLLYRALVEEAYSIRAADQQVLRMAGNEIYKFQRAIDSYVYGNDTHDNLILYYDILYSRAQLMETKRILVAFKDFFPTIQELIHRIYELDPVILRLEGPESEVVNELRTKVQEIHDLWESASLLVFQRSIDNSTEEKEQQIDLAIILGLSLFLLAASVSALLIILFKQMKIRQEDLARERLLSKRLVATTKAVEAASQAKSMFLQTMSHEIRTPLNAISGFSQLLNTTQLNEKQSSYAENIDEATHKLTNLIGDILDYVELEGEDFECKKVEFEIGMLMSDLRLYLVKHIEQEEKDLTLKVIASKDVPRLLISDQVQLYRVLTHLGMNAIKFSREIGDIYIRLDVVDAENEQKMLRFEVEDFGVGVPEEFQEAVFEAFSQADQSMGREFEGTGLGLAICKRLVDLLGGEIGLKQKENAGALFWIEIPLETDLKAI